MLDDPAQETYQRTGLVRAARTGHCLNLAALAWRLQVCGPVPLEELRGGPNPNFRSCKRGKSLRRGHMTRLRMCTLLGTDHGLTPRRSKALA